MDKKERDSSFMKSDDTRSHISGISSQPSHSSQSHNSGHSSLSSRLPFDKYNFPRHVLQNLGVLGKENYNSSGVNINR